MSRRKGKCRDSEVRETSGLFIARIARGNCGRGREKATWWSKKGNKETGTSEEDLTIPIEDSARAETLIEVEGLLCGTQGLVDLQSRAGEEGGKGSELAAEYPCGSNELKSGATYLNKTWETEEGDRGITLGSYSTVEP